MGPLLEGSSFSEISNQCHCDGEWCPWIFLGPRWPTCLMWTFVGECQARIVRYLIMRAKSCIRLVFRMKSTTSCNQATFTKTYLHFLSFQHLGLSSPWFQAGSIHWTSTIIYVFLFFKRKTMKNPLDRFFPSFLTTLIAVFLFFCVLICAVPSSQASSSASARRVVPTCSPAWNSSATCGWRRARPTPSCRAPFQRPTNGGEGDGGMGGWGDGGMRWFRCTNYSVMLGTTMWNHV